MDACDYADLQSTHKQLLLRWLRQPQANYPLVFALLHALRNTVDGSALEKVSALAGDDTKTRRQIRIRAVNNSFVLNSVGITVAPFRRFVLDNRKAGPPGDKEKAASNKAAKKQMEIEAVARECMASILLNRDQEQQPKTLLRPSTVSAAYSPQVLQRPDLGSSASMTRPDELLLAPDSDLQAGSILL